MADRRRILVDRINRNIGLQSLGIDANLIYDRLVTASDDAGLCPGEPFLIKAKCFPYMAEMTIERIEAGLRLLTGKYIWSLAWRGVSVLHFHPETFREIQKLRKDFVRQFDFGELSQLVWEQGLPGIRSAIERDANGSRPELAHISISTSISTSDGVPSSFPADAGADEGHRKERKPRQQQPRKSPTGDHAAFIEHFVTRWAERHGGAKYAFLDGKDGSAAAKVLKLAGSLAKATAIADRYLDCADPFIAERGGHSLSMLLNQINRFVAEKSVTRTDDSPFDLDDVGCTVEQLAVACHTTPEDLRAAPEKFQVTQDDLAECERRSSQR